MFEHSRCIPSQCSLCAYNGRCNNSCSCLNWKTTGTLNNPSPVVCETERLLIPIVDKLGADLFKKRAPGFIQKHYNPAYPLLSLMEDLLYMS
ncbi:MAG: hypothetical protein GXY77_17865 [Fibrobacter sp.]|nr:hypothetical protein [Fibrobacter sp.]